MTQTPAIETPTTERPQPRRTTQFALEWSGTLFTADPDPDDPYYPHHCHPTSYVCPTEVISLRLSFLPRRDEPA